jgi:hypothetical protein
MSATMEITIHDIECQYIQGMEFTYEYGQFSVSVNIGGLSKPVVFVDDDAVEFMKYYNVWREQQLDYQLLNEYSGDEVPEQPDLDVVPQKVKGNYPHRKRSEL